MIIHVADGRQLWVPLEWFPRLLNAPQSARNNWRFIGKGAGIHWPELDEDVSVLALFDEASVRELQKRMHE
jgi:hypothetical protein